MTCKTVETDLDTGVLNNTEWIHRWEVGKIGFHQPVYDKFLDEREDIMFGGKTKSVLAPLCGKALDLVWMYERGHSVCGVEFVEQAVTEFFTENNIPFDVEDLGEKGKRYKSKDGRLVIYRADLFDMDADLCGQFDVIWDSRSLSAINLADHNSYSALLLSMMKQDGLYFLSTLDYDEAAWPGPPHSISVKRIQEVYGDRCNIELVEETDKTGTGYNSQGQPTADGQPQKPPSSAGAAIKSASFCYTRWHKLTLK